MAKLHGEARSFTNRGDGKITGLFRAARTVRRLRTSHCTNVISCCTLSSRPTLPPTPCNRSRWFYGSTVGRTPTRRMFAQNGRIARTPTSRSRVTRRLLNRTAPTGLHTSGGTSTSAAKILRWSLHRLSVAVSLLTIFACFTAILTGRCQRVNASAS